MSEPVGEPVGPFESGVAALCWDPTSFHLLAAESSSESLPPPPWRGHPSAPRAIGTTPRLLQVAFARPAGGRAVVAASASVAHCLLAGDRLLLVRPPPPPRRAFPPVVTSSRMVCPGSISQAGDGDSEEEEEAGAGPRDGKSESKAKAEARGDAGWWGGGRSAPAAAAPSSAPRSFEPPAPPPASPSSVDHLVIPQGYLGANWPPRLVALSSDGGDIAGARFRPIVIVVSHDLFAVLVRE